MNCQIDHYGFCCVYSTSYVAYVMPCVYMAPLQSTGCVHGRSVKDEVLSVQAEL